MKIHSVKVPRLYKVAAEVAKEVSEGIGSIKTLVYEKQKKHPNIKAIYALVTTLFQKAEEIETLLKRSQILVKETKFNPWLAKVLIVELLWGKQYLPGQSKPENTVRAYEQIFKAHLSDSKGKEIEQKEHDSKPRYVRVNTLRSNLNEAVEAFREEGWILNKFFDKNDYKGFLDRVSCLQEGEFMIDIHVPNLLIFPPRTEFYRHPAYKNGSIVLQDKASCLPVHILSSPPGSTVLDMCAAPGMKTTHLAAILNDEGTVYATEKNPKRFEILNTIISTSGAKCIKTFNKDVLDCTKSDFPDVEYILVDPSCSGTGMTDRPQENEIEPSRLARLTGFQIKILRHALTKFPNAKRVVYSTCSVLAEENEEVVRQVLETNYNFKLISGSQFVGDTWQNYGSPEYGDIGKFCLYTKPSDCTNGFFVAVFERLQEGEENPFFNTRIFNFKKHVQENEKWKLKKQRKYEHNVNNDEFEENNTNPRWNKKEGKNKQNTSRNNDYVQSEGSNDDISRENENETVQISIEDQVSIRNENSLEEMQQMENINKLEEEVKPKKKRKKDNSIENQTSIEEISLKNLDNSESKKKKKKKNKSDDLQNHSEMLENVEKDKHDDIVNSVKIKKKEKAKKESKFKDTDIYEEDNNVEVFSESNDVKRKKKKQKNAEETLDNISESPDLNIETESGSKKKKKKKSKKQNLE